MDGSFRREFLTELYRHGLHLEYNLSLYFSPNTHLLGEALALHAIGRLFPEFPRSASWRKTARHPGGGAPSRSTPMAVTSSNPLTTTCMRSTCSCFITFWSRCPSRERLGAMGGVPGRHRRTGRHSSLPGRRRWRPPVSSVRTAERVCASHAGDRGSPGTRVFPRTASSICWIRRCGGLAPRRWPRNQRPWAPPLSRYFPQSGLISMRSGDAHVLFDAGPFGPGAADTAIPIRSASSPPAASGEILDRPGDLYVCRRRGMEEPVSGVGVAQYHPRGRPRPGLSAGPFRWLNKPSRGSALWDKSAGAGHPGSGLLVRRASVTGAAFRLPKPTGC